MEWMIIPLVIVMGMIGGQFLKVVRRYGTPISSLIFVVSNKEKRKNWKIYLLALLALVLSMGYGQNSRLSKLCKGNDTVVRLIYGFLLGLIIGIAGFWYAIFIMPFVWVKHLPYSFKIGKYDFLWEDFLRYGALGFCIWGAIR